MVDPDDIVLCEHAYEPDECPVCGGPEADEFPAFDVHGWLEAYRDRERPDVPPALVGVPFS